MKIGTPSFPFGLEKVQPKNFGKVNFCFWLANPPYGLIKTKTKNHREWRTKIKLIQNHTFPLYNFKPKILASRHVSKESLTEKVMCHYKHATNISCVPYTNSVYIRIIRKSSFQLKLNYITVEAWSFLCEKNIYCLKICEIDFSCCLENQIKKKFSRRSWTLDCPKYLVVTLLKWHKILSDALVINFNLFVVPKLYLFFIYTTILEY